MDQDCYGNVKEEIPKDIAKPLGKRVITTTFLDANLLQNIYQENQHSCITLCQPHPSRLVFKETSHCGDSNIRFRVCSSQNCNRTNHGPQKHTKISRCPHHDQGIYGFGDNKSVVTNSTIPQSILNKRHNMLSYHRVRVTEVWPQNTKLSGFEVGALLLLVVDTQLVDVTQTTTKSIRERLRKHNNQAKIDTIGLKTLRIVEVLPWVAACEKHYKSQWMCITFCYNSGL